MLLQGAGRGGRARGAGGLHRRVGRRQFCSLFLPNMPMSNSRDFSVKPL